MREREDKNIGDSVRMYVVVLSTIIILGIVGYSVYVVRAYIAYVGFVAVGASILLIIVALCIAITYAIRFLSKVEEYVIGENGTALRGIAGRVTLLAPMSANQAVVAKRGKKVIVTPVIPSILEEIENGVIAIGQLSMHMGYEKSKTGLLPIIDAWPGTFAIAGRGRSGKTRRVLTIIMQALIGNCRVFICDPHSHKPDSLTNLLGPLASRLTIARGDVEIVEMSRYFLAEMENRVQGLSQDATPWLIIYDEFSRLMTTTKIDDDDKQVIQDCVVHCSTEYAGFLGFAGIIGQVWTEDATGGTAIRRSLHKVFVHQLSAEYSKFFLKGRWANKSEDLSSRECLYRQDGEVKLIATHTVPDDTSSWFADWLDEHMPVGEIAAAPTRLRLAPAQSRPARERVETPARESAQDETLYLGPAQAHRTDDLSFDELDMPETPQEHPAIVSSVPRESKDDRELAMVVDAWAHDYKSIFKVMEATGLGQNRSRVLIAMAKSKGLINSEE